MDDLTTHLKETARAMGQALVEQLPEREHPAAAGFRDRMRSVREDFAALEGETHEFCFRCRRHHVLGKECPK